MAPHHRLSAVTPTSDEIEDLIYACRAGDLEQLQEDLRATSQRHATTVSQLIKSAIDADSDGLGSGNCLLHYPAANGGLEILQYLLEQLSDPSLPTPVASNTAAPDSLVNHRNVSGNTPLHWAALNGHLEIVKALVKAGADPTLVNEAGRDAVVEAEYSAKEEAQACADWLLKECPALEHGAGTGVVEGDARDEEMGDEEDVGEGSSVTNRVNNTSDEGRNTT